MTDTSSIPPAARSLVERLYETLPTGDRPALTTLLADDFVGRVTPGLPFGIGGEHRGPDAMIDEVWFAIGARWRVRAVPEQWSALSDGRLLVSGSYRGTGRRSGAPVDAWFTHVWTIRDGVVAGVDQTTDSAAFIAALSPTDTGEPRPQRIGLSIVEGVATLCLARPEARNAMDQQMADELLAASVRIAGDTSVRAVLICAEGPDLTVGGDIGHFTEHAGADFGSTLRRMTTPFHLALQVLATLDAPIVTVAHGAVAGGGLGLVYAADVVVATETARFVTAFGAIGLSGDGGGTWHLPRRIGPARAAWAYLANEPITAQQALDWGLVTEVVHGGDARSRGEELARRLAGGPTRAFGRMRALLRESWDRSLPDQLNAEVEALVASANTADARGAIHAFAAKQRPEFEGA